MKISVIGAGAMGGAIVEGLVRNGYNKEDIRVADPMSATRDRFAAMGVSVSSDNTQVVPDADIVCVVVKPWLVEQVLSGIRDVLDYEHQILVVVAAGVKMADVDTWMTRQGQMLPTFLVIPNTAIAYSQSMTFIVAGSTAQAQHTQAVMSLFNSLGTAMLVEERLLEAGMALASCGIAYALRYVRAATEGGVQMGFRAAEAQRIVAQTLQGAASLLEGGSHAEAEIDKVTTPGGRTIRGLNAMEQAGFTNAVIQGLLASLA